MGDAPTLKLVKTVAGAAPRTPRRRPPRAPHHLHRRRQGRHRQEPHLREPRHRARPARQEGRARRRGPRRREPAHDARARRCRSARSRTSSSGRSSASTTSSRRPASRTSASSPARSTTSTPRTRSHAQKMRLLRHVQQLDVDYAILDLGAGTHSNVLDFFLVSDHGVLVLVPEPTAVENAYRFVKAAFWRRMRNVAQVFGYDALLRSVMAQRHVQEPGRARRHADAARSGGGAEPRPAARRVPAAPRREPGADAAGRGRRPGGGRRLAEVLRPRDGLPRLHPLRRRDVARGPRAPAAPRRAAGRAGRALLRGHRRRAARARRRRAAEARSEAARAADALRDPRGAAGRRPRRDRGRATRGRATSYAPGSLVTYSPHVAGGRGAPRARLEEARATLLDPAARARYDARLGGPRARRPAAEPALAAGDSRRSSPRS